MTDDKNIIRKIYVQDKYIDVSEKKEKKTVRFVRVNSDIRGIQFSAFQIMKQRGANRITFDKLRSNVHCSKGL